MLLRKIDEKLLIISKGKLNIETSILEFQNFKNFLAIKYLLIYFYVLVRNKGK